MPERAPGPGEQYRFHFDMGKCIGCKCCVVACNEQNGNPAAINWRRVGEIEGGWFPNATRSYLSMGCNHCLEPTCLRAARSMPTRRIRSTGIVQPQRRRLHRLPVLHLELLVRRAAVQPRARRRRQVRHVPRPSGARAGAGLRERLSGGRDRDRDREHRGLAGVGRGAPRRVDRACPSAITACRRRAITLPDRCRPNATAASTSPTSSPSIRTGRWW